MSTNRLYDSLLSLPLFLGMTRKLLQRFFNVFAFFYRYYNHFVTINMLLVKKFRSQIASQNYTYFLYSQNFRQIFLKNYS